MHQVLNLIFIDTIVHRGHKLVIDPETLSAVVKLIYQVRTQTEIDKENDNGHVRSFVYEDVTDSPSQVVPQLASPPLFPRDRKPGGSLSTTLVATRESGLKDLKELGSILLPGNVNSDGSDDLYKDHMTLVDGWGVYSRRILRICANYSHSPARNISHSIISNSLFKFLVQ